MKDYNVLYSDLKDDIMVKIEDAFDKGYIQGRDDGKAEGMDSVYREGYGKGLSEAWEAARKICTNLSDNELSEIFGAGKTIDEIMKTHFASDAIRKIKKYEEEQNHLHVGDEVRNGTIVGVVTYIADELYIQVMTSDGSLGDWSKDEVIKTGRHFDQIMAVRESLYKGGEE